MDHISNLENLTRVTRRREFDDGLMDFVYGSFFLLLSLFGWLFFSSTGLRWFFTALLYNREVTIIGLVALVALFILFISGAKRIVARIRESVIWKDRGVVKSLRWQVSWPINLLAGLVSIIMIIGAVWLTIRGSLSQEAVLRALVSSMGVASGIVYFGMGKELGLPRYKWVGVAGGMFSALILIMPISFSVSWLLLGIVWMAVLSISGIWALRQSLLILEERNSG